MESKYFEGSYAHNEYFEYALVQFGNGAFLMDLFLPKEGISLSEADRLICTESSSELIAAQQSTNVKLYMPRFAISSRSDLSDMLMSIGKDELVNFEFNIFPTANQGLVDYKQSSQLSIDEDGAKVESITSGEIIPTSPMPVESEVVINIDRPFYFFIRERSTQACILSGRITDPE